MTSAKRRARVDRVREGRNILHDDVIHYLTRVLRLGAGDRVELFDGEGGFGVGTLAHVGQQWAVEIERTERSDPPLLTLTLAAAPPKGDRADVLVEKASELGVSELVWLECERSVVKLKEGSNKLERFRRISDAAARQSRRTRSMSIAGPVRFDLFLHHPFDGRWLAHPGGETLRTPTREPPRTGALLIGPEGGFSETEVSQALEAGYTLFTLGAHVLRVETAALAGSVLILNQYAR